MNLQVGDVVEVAVVGPVADAQEVLTALALGFENEGMLVPLTPPTEQTTFNLATQLLQDFAVAFAAELTLEALIASTRRLLGKRSERAASGTPTTNQRITINMRSVGVAELQIHIGDDGQH